jgi:hypothetical protein
MSLTITKPVFKPQIDFEVAFDQETERSTIIHCTITISCLLRISPDTWLIQQDGKRKRLLHAYNIAEHPNWKVAFPNHCFTLVFEGLDRNCIHFDLFEDIQEHYPFHFKDIYRNEMDVYWLEYPNFKLD